MKRRLENDAGWDEFGDSDSDDSIDLEALSVTNNAPSGTGEYGLGASLMARMGYSAGQGLGAQKQGIVAPVEQVQRFRNVGIGAKNAEKRSVKVDLSGPSTTDAKNPRDSTKLANERRLIQLKQIRESLDTLTSVEFIEQYSQWPIWDEFKLYDAVFAKAVVEFQAVSFEQLSENIPKLTLIKSVLSSRSWDALILKIWSSRFHQYTQQAGVNVAVDHLKTLKDLLLPSIIEMSMNEYLITHCHEILTDCDCFNSVLKLSPRFPSLVRELVPLDEFTEKELSVLGLVYTKVQALLQCESLNLNDIRAIIEEWKPKLDNNELCSLIDQYLVPFWKKELEKLALTNKLTQKWWLSYKPYIHNPKDLLWGLNSINWIRDTGHSLHASEVEMNFAKPVTSRDVIEHYCYVNELKCQFDSNDTGMIKGPKAGLTFEIKHGVLFDASTQDPISFGSLKNMVK